jgi:hypothetical protein
MLFSNLALSAPVGGLGADFDQSRSRGSVLGEAASFLPQPARACGGGSELVARLSFRRWPRLAGARRDLGGLAASWLFKFTAKPHFLLEQCTASVSAA